MIVLNQRAVRQVVIGAVVGLAVAVAYDALREPPVRHAGIPPEGRWTMPVTLGVLALIAVASVIDLVERLVEGKRDGDTFGRLFAAEDGGSLSYVATWQFGFGLFAVGAVVFALVL